MGVFRTKPVSQLLSEAQADHHRLRRTLGAFDLTALGVGAIIGTGIFVLTGVVAARFAGPAVVLSFVVAGVASAFAALVYAELAAMVPVAGSAYTYSYAALGELVAWIIGWDLILEYTVAASAVAIGWSGYVVELLKATGLSLPRWAVAGPSAGGIINLPAIAIVFLIATIVVLGSRESATANVIVVGVKLAVILAFIALGVTRVNTALWSPFLPFGPLGVVKGAAIIFFAFIGFDAVSTAAEEVKRPGRDLPVGILVSLFISTLIYVAVAAILTGIVSYRSLDTPSPLAFALSRAGIRLGSAIVAAGALTGLTSVLLVDVFAQSRVFFAMARDGLLPPLFARVHPRFRTPYINTVLTAVAVAALAAFLPVTAVAQLANIGTLAAFVLVSAGSIVLRLTRPELPRPFKTPLFPLVPLLAMFSSAYLMLNLPRFTWIRFGIWLAIGMVIYFGYGVRKSRLAPGPEPPLPELEPSPAS